MYFNNNSSRNSKLGTGKLQNCHIEHGLKIKTKYLEKKGPI